MRAPLSLATIIAAGVVYHLAQKTSNATTPWRMLAVAYGAAFGVTLVLALATGGAPRWELGRDDGIAGLLLGLAVLGIEAGFFFLYRAGWSLSTASVIANVSVAATLAAVGIIVFREDLTAARGAGLALAVAGATLIARG
jgi:drug/metabolite transporter (DMT)-like permease